MWFKASASIVEGFLQSQDILAKAGILDNPYRLAVRHQNRFRVLPHAA
jgi:hypothetical protein